MVRQGIRGLSSRYNEVRLLEVYVKKSTGRCATCVRVVPRPDISGLRLMYNSRCRFVTYLLQIKTAAVVDASLQNRVLLRELGVFSQCCAPLALVLESPINRA